MKESTYKRYEDLTLFLNAAIGERRSIGMSEPRHWRRGKGYGVCDDEAKVLGVSPSSGYELMHEPGFPVLRIGNRMVVPKEQFIQWVNEHTGGWK